MPSTKDTDKRMIGSTRFNTAESGAIHSDDGVDIHTTDDKTKTNKWAICRD